MSTYVIEGSLAEILALEERLASHYKKKLAELASRKISAVSSRAFICTHCKCSSPLGKMDFIQDYWYEGPRGCTGGDTWHKSNKDLCHLVCPYCSQWNYLYNHPQKDELITCLEKTRLSDDQIFKTVFDNHPINNEPNLTQTHPQNSSLHTDSGY